MRNPPQFFKTTLLCFVISIAVSCFAIYMLEKNRYQNKRLNIRSISSSYANLIVNNINQALSATYPLAALVRKQHGDINGFEELASQLLPYYPGAACLQLAPNGVIEHIVPLEGNEKALGYNLFDDSQRNKGAFLARDSGNLTLDGPFHLLQGGLAAAGRLPIFLEDSTDEQAFWGFSTVLIRFPKVLESAKLDNLATRGIAYELSRIHPESGDTQIIAKSAIPIGADFVRLAIDMPNGQWSFKVSPTDGWLNPIILWFEFLLGLLFSILTTFSLALVLRLKHAQQSLEHTVERRTKSLNESLTRLQLALNVSSQGWFDLDVKTGTMLIGEELAELLGFARKQFQMPLKDLSRYIHREDRHEILHKLGNPLQLNSPQTLEYRWHMQNGKWLWLRSTSETVEWDHQHSPLRIVGIQTNITHQHNSEQVLRLLAESSPASDKNILRLIVRQLAITYDVRYAFISFIDKLNPEVAETLAVWANGDYQDNFRYVLADTPCEQASNGLCFYPENVQQLFPKDQILAEMEAFSYLGVPLKNSRDEVHGIIAILDDKVMPEHPHIANLFNSLAVRVTMELERMRAFEKLNLSARVFSEAHEGIMITDANARIIDVNPTFVQITGYNRDELLGRNPNILNSGKQDSSYYQNMWRALIEDAHWQGEIWNRKKNGGLYAEILTISALKNEDGETTHYIALFSDITEIKKQQQTLELMAHYDMLTKLPNRVLLSDRYNQAVAHSKRNKSLLAICYLDLDNFKPVNDFFGHDVGDQLLTDVSERIKTNIRAEDTACRLGGDEFALLLGNIISLAHCEQLINRLLDAINKPYLITRQSIHISASCGVSIYPHEQADIDTLLRHADQAMYQAKLTGKNGFFFFNAEEDQMEAQRQNQLKDIQQALIEQQFQLYYQPKVNLKTGEVFGVEALIRWQHPEKGLIPPGKFLPVIENTKLEIAIGNWVITQALQQIDLWFAQGLALEVSINVSSNHLQSENFFSILDDALAKHPDVDSRFLQLEILESSALSNLQTISKIIKTCRETLGISIALDDFGTGYSSLTHLRNLPANTIKIDRSFVADILDDPNDFAIIDGVIGLADSFNRDVIAEGVETIEHGQILMLMGCQLAQGFGIARPMPAVEIPEWVRHYKPIRQWLSYGDKTLTPQQCRIEMLKLALNHWFLRFKSKIQTTPNHIGNWPIMNSSKCHCGVWIKRAEQEQLFATGWLATFDQKHEHMHNVANKLFALYQSNETELAINQLDELQIIYQDMCRTLEQFDANQSFNAL